MEKKKRRVLLDEEEFDAFWEMVLAAYKILRKKEGAKQRE